MTDIIKGSHAERRRAFAAWGNRSSVRSFEELESLWENAREALDFSWAGLASLEDAFKPAAVLKQWEAPLWYLQSAPNPNGSSDEFQLLTLQDFWVPNTNWGLGQLGFTEAELTVIRRKLSEDNIYKNGRATVAAMKAAGHLAEHKGLLWHLAHLPRPLSAHEADILSTIVSKRISAFCGQFRGLSSVNPERVLAVPLTGVWASDMFSQFIENCLTKVESWNKQCVPDRPIVLTGAWSRLPYFRINSKVLDISIACPNSVVAGIAIDYSVIQAYFDLSGCLIKGLLSIVGCVACLALHVEFAKLSQVQLRKSRFAGRFSFQGAYFNGEFDANRVDFDDYVDFTNCHFRQEAVFYSSHFKYIAIFIRTVFEDRFDGRDVTFDHTTDFDGATFKDFVQFAGAEFERGLLLANLKFPGFLKYCKRDWPFLRRFVGRLAGSRSDRDQFFHYYTVTFRQLRQAAHHAGDVRSSYQLFRLEQIARRHRCFEVSNAEKFASILYGMLSNYGESILRPMLFGILIFPLLFAGAYLYATTNIQPHPDAIAELRTTVRQDNAADQKAVIDTLDFSYLNTLRPLSVWDTDMLDHSNSVARTLLLADAHQGIYVITKAMASLQSVLSIVCLFLAGLGLRRRFQFD